MSEANFKKGRIADRIPDYIAFNTNAFRNYNAHMAQMDFAISTTITKMRANKQTYGEAYEARLNEAEVIMRKLFKEKAWNTHSTTTHGQLNS